MNVRNDLSSTQRVNSNAQLTGALHSRVASGVLSATADDSSDQTRLSSTASLASQAAALPDVRMDKVTAMQNAISNGYRVDSSDVAGAMMNHMLNRSE